MTWFHENKQIFLEKMRRVSKIHSVKIKEYFSVLYRELWITFVIPHHNSTNRNF